jgi:hypothetical protein
MSFPKNWNQAASHRLATIAQGTVHRALGQEGTWSATLPSLRAAVRYSAGYDAATADRMAPADAFGRRVVLTRPHFEIQVEPGQRWRPAGAIFYRVRAEEAAQLLKAEWGSAIFTELSPQAAHQVTEMILGPLGDP